MESTWPGVTKLPDYKTTFPKWPSQDLAALVPTLDADGLDVLSVISVLIIFLEMENCCCLDFALLAFANAHSAYTLFIACLRNS